MNGWDGKNGWMGHDKTRCLVNGIKDESDDRIGWMNGELHEWNDGWNHK